ncbi:MAG: hypothetical protein H0T78_06850 [Longispora sp.]|nr:hypothetical protein [Longispora sp. (in: high G+C Gram-positive bacteria)]
MATSLVFFLASIVVLVGGVVELIQVLRSPPPPHGRPGDLLRGTKTVSNVSSWVGVTAMVVLFVGFMRDVTFSARDIAPVVFCLGFAAERATYLLTLWGRNRGNGNFAAYVAAAAITVVGGAVIGLSL